MYFPYKIMVKNKSEKFSSAPEYNYLNIVAGCNLGMLVFSSF